MLETESLVWIIGNDSAVIFFFSISDLFYKIPIIFFFFTVWGLHEHDPLELRDFPAFQF